MKGDILIKNIDFDMLKVQKAILLEMMEEWDYRGGEEREIAEESQGLVHMIDDMEDAQIAKTQSVKIAQSLPSVKAVKESRFFVKGNFGFWSVMDKNDNIKVIGYNIKSEAEITANGLNRLRKEESISKMKRTLQTIKGYGHYIRIAKNKA
ncbi:MAG: hypothetical protein ACI9QN_000565 [Arcticibacterium sp.]|jgi:hypothetical protein